MATTYPNIISNKKLIRITKKIEGFESDKL